jgi:membrane associated rhomboid family serine protease
MASGRPTWGGGYDSPRYYRPTFFGGFGFFPPVIKALLIANVAVFLFQFFIGPLRVGGVPLTYILFTWGALSPIGSNFYPWQLFTYMFLHDGVIHLFFNMFALWMFGMEIEHTWGSKKFLSFYLLCGIGAGLSNLFIGPLFATPGPTVGASGAVYGILLAFALLFPNRPVFLFPLFYPIKAKYLVGLYILLEIFSGVSGTRDGVAHFAHLGGAAVGYVFLLFDRRKFPFEGVFSRVKTTWSTLNSRREPFESVPRRETTDAKFTELDEERTKGEGEIAQERIDAILDKISVSGYQSLTEEEKRILFDASKKLN